MSSWYCISAGFRHGGGMLSSVCSRVARLRLRGNLVVIVVVVVIIVTILTYLLTYLLTYCYSIVINLWRNRVKVYYRHLPHVTAALRPVSVVTTELMTCNVQQRLDCGLKHVCTIYTTCLAANCLQNQSSIYRVPPKNVHRQTLRFTSAKGVM